MNFGFIAVLQGVELSLELQDVLMYSLCIILFSCAYVLSSTQELSVKFSSKSFCYF